MSKDKIIDRIKKLLSLSKSSNEHEAAQAAALAADLMLSNEIEEAALCEPEDAPEDVGADTLDELGKQRTPWKGTLAHCLTQSAGCRSYTSRRTGQVTIQIVGQPSKVATVRYMYAYLVGEINRLADSAFREEHAECSRSGVPAPSARAWKNAFRLGAAGVIGNRVMAQRKETHAKAKASGAGTSLAVIETAEKAVEQYVRRTVGRLGSSPRPQFSSRSGYGAGAAAGQNVSLGGGRGLGAGAKQLGN